MEISNYQARELVQSITDLKREYREKLKSLEFQLDSIRKQCSHQYIEVKVLDHNGVDVTGMTPQQVFQKTSSKVFNITEVCTVCGNVQKLNDY